jgi:hypothetical protein
MGNRTIERPEVTQDNIIQKKRGHTLMPGAGMEIDIPVFELFKVVSALGSSITLIDVVC